MDLLVFHPKSHQSWVLNCIFFFFSLLTLHFLHSIAQLWRSENMSLDREWMKIKKSKNMNVKCFDTFIQLSLLEYKYNCSSDMQYANYTYCVTHIISCEGKSGGREKIKHFFRYFSPFVSFGKCVMCLWRWKWNKKQWRLANRRK